MAYKYDYSSCPEVQLKAILLARNLDITGSKDELVTRLSDCDIKDTVKKESKEDEKENEPRSPKLLLKYLKYGYDITSCLRTVIVNPFFQSFTQMPGVFDILDSAPSYTMHKAKTGQCAAILRFDTVDEGDLKLHELRGLLRGCECEVSHPPFPDTFPKAADDNQVHDYFDTLFEVPTGDLLSRLVIVENLPAETNVDEKLNELFPDAIKTICYQFNQWSHGLAILEFMNEKAVEDFLLTIENSEMTIDGRKIQIFKYTERRDQWTKDKVKGKKKQPENTDTAFLVDTSRDLSDEERILLNKGLKSFYSDPKIENSEEVFGMEKILKFQAKNGLLRSLLRLLSADTRRRLKLGVKIPEPKELMVPVTEKILERAEQQAGVVVKEKEKGIPTESGHMTKIKLYEQQRREHESERLRLELIIKSMEGQLKGPEKSEWEEIKSGTSTTLVSEPVLDPTSGKLSREQQQKFLQQAQLETQKKNAMATMRLIEAKNARGGQKGGARGRGRGGANRGGGAHEGYGGANNRGGGAINRGGGANNREGGAINRGGGANNRGGGFMRGGGFERGGLSPRGGGANNRGGGANNRGGGANNRGGGANNRGGRGNNRGGGFMRGGGFERGGGANSRGGGAQRGREYGSIQGQMKTNTDSFGELPPPPTPAFLVAGSKRKGGNPNFEGQSPFKRQGMSSGNVDSAYLEGLATVLDGKMKKLEEMQEQTLRAQEELLRQQKSRPSDSLLGPGPVKTEPDYQPAYSSKQPY